MKSRTYGNDKELQRLENMLAAKDFSLDSNKEGVYRQVRGKLAETSRLAGVQGERGSAGLPVVGGAMRMNGIWRRKRQLRAAAAAFVMLCLVSVAIMGTTSAQSVLGRIVKTITLNHSSFIQVEPSESLPVPQEWAGKVFDKDGKPLLTMEQDTPLYTAEGEQIVDIQDGVMLTEKGLVSQGFETERYLTIRDPKKISAYLDFSLVLPSYLPNGYEFDRARLYKDGSKVSGSYVDLYFRNKKEDKEIFMQQRKDTLENATVLMTEGEVEEVELGAVKAIMTDNTSLDWSNKGVMYFLSRKDNITMKEMLHIAESMIAAEGK